MTAESIREQLTARPFRAFRVHTAAGREYPVKHPDFAMFTPSGRDLIVTFDEDRVAIISLLHVTELETMPAQSADSNG